MLIKSLFTQLIMCWRVGTGILMLQLLFASSKLSTTLEICFTQHFLKIALNGLFGQTYMGWHFEIQPAGIAKIKISQLSSNYSFFSPSVKCAVKGSNDTIEFWNPNLLYPVWVCLTPISSTHTFIKSSSIQVFFCVLTVKLGGILRLLTVWLVFPLKIIVGGSICPFAVADNTTIRCFFALPEERTNCWWYY